jgi:hypothetical protein
VEKMQFIFFVPPNEELEGALHPQKFGCTPKNEGKRVHKTGNSRSLFRNPIPVFHFRNFQLNDELCSFSTFFALNFDKKLAVE